MHTGLRFTDLPSNLPLVPVYVSETLTCLDAGCSKIICRNFCRINTKFDAVTTHHLLVVLGACAFSTVLRTKMYWLFALQ